MLETWVNFYNKLNGKYLGGYTQKGTFQGELESTLELKAYDNGINVSDIEVRYEKEQFEYEAISIDSELVQGLMDSSSGIAIQISEYEQLKGLEGLEDGWYLVKGTKQVIQKEGNRLSITMIDGEHSFMDELKLSFYY